MRSLHIIIIILFLAPHPVARAQNMVIGAGSLEQPDRLFFLPDVEGKAVISLEMRDYLTSGTGVDSLTVYPGFPVTRTGQNERGGCYGNLDNDPELEIIYTAGNTVYAFNRNGTSVAGWPRVLDFPADGAAAFGDIDGDGFGEIVVTTHQTATFATGTIYAFEINGTNVLGFPITTEGGALRTPVLADIDGNGALEIIVAIRRHPEGFIYIYRGNGTVFPDWPKRLDYVPGSAVAVGDITGDGVPEIIAESYNGLHAFTADGILMPGFPYYPGTNRVFSYSTPVLADIDGDGLREIICGDHSVNQGNGAVHIVKNDGTSFPGWPKFTGSWIYGPPSVGDIDGDGLLDVAVGDQTLSATPQNKVYAWTAITGNPLPGFPIENLFAVNSQIILADLDGDGSIELMFDDNTSNGKYLAYNHDGSPMDDWPVTVAGSTFFINPFIFDIDHDGIMDISGAGYDQATNNINIYLWNAHVTLDDELAILPILQYNTRHSGVYGDYLMVGAPEIPERETAVFSISPNPAFRQIQVSMSPGQRQPLPEGPVTARIHAPDGRLIILQELPESTEEWLIPLPDVKDGLYFLIISSPKIQQVLKFVVLQP
jgi:hypothetical protein